MIPPALRKTLRLLAALALAAGGVWVLRFAARDLLRPPPPPAAAPAGAARATPAPKALDLAAEVPRALWTTLGGLAPERTEETLPMPAEQARAEVAARLEAKGWRPLADALPLDQAHLLALAGDALYVTPEQAFAHVAIVPRADGGCQVRTFLLPTAGAEPIDPASLATAPDGFALMARSAARLRPERRLPHWMRALCQGHALATRLIRRRTGATFYLSALAPGAPGAALARVGDAAAAAGWRREAAPVDALRAAGVHPGGATATFVYRNVACNVRAAPGPRAGASALVYRFTDDEVYARPPRKETP